MNRRFSPHWTRWYRLGWLVLVAGCATVPEAPRLPPGAIAVVSGRYPPKADFNIFARGKGAAAGDLGGKGAASGAAVGAVAPLQLGPLGIAAYPIMAPFTILAGIVVGGAVGATYGAMHGLSAEQVERVNALAERAIAQLGAQQEVAKRVAAKARGRTLTFELVSGIGPQAMGETPDYGELRPQFGAVVELAVDRITMAARKGEPARIALEMNLHLRWMTLAEPRVSVDKHFQWAGKPITIDEWQAGGADLLAREFERAYENLSDYATENLVPNDELPGKL
jgi:hypothetical protein